MNTILENKKTIAIILITLLTGVIIGWVVKPAGEHNDHSASVHQHETAEVVWTCSMHPQIKRNEPGDCPICGMDLIPLSKRQSASGNPLIYEMTPEAVAMASIHTSRVSGVSANGEILLTGKIQADERELASITAYYPGRIDKLFVNFTGQVIKPGERLASIYSPELITAQTELLEARSSKAIFPELYTAAREKLRLWKLTEKQIESIETSGEIKNQFDVLATKGGVVTQLNVAVGDYVSTGSLLFVAVDLNKLWVMIDAYESDLPVIKIGNAIHFTVAGVPGRTFTAKVAYVDRVINPNTRTASIRAEITNENGVLKPEMFVNARIQTTNRKEQSVLSIPRTAVLWSGKRSVVYVKVPGTEFPAFEMREITIGSRVGENYPVEAGLEAGEEIVTNGVFAIDAAAQLSGNYSMLKRPESKNLEVPQAFRKQITAVVEDYFKIKNALVESDAQSTKEAVEKIGLSITKVEKQNLNTEVHDRWISLKNEIQKSLVAMQKTKDLSSLRAHFEMLSEKMVEAVEVFGVEKDKVYKDFCPMAMNNKGAYWLSEVEEILNPYFGDAMLTCGEVIQTYRNAQPISTIRP